MNELKDRSARLVAGVNTLVEGGKRSGVHLEMHIDGQSVWFVIETSAARDFAAKIEEAAVKADKLNEEELPS